MDISDVGIGTASRREAMKGMAAAGALLAAGTAAAAIRPPSILVGLYASEASAAALPWADYAAASAKGAAILLADAGLSYRQVLGAEAANGGAGLARFDVIVAPHVLRMSDREVVALDAFVARGGLLIASGMTAGFHVDGRARSSMPLACSPIAAFGAPQDARGWLLDTAHGPLRRAIAPMPLDGVYFGGAARADAAGFLPVIPDLRWGPPEYSEVEPDDQVRPVAGLLVRRYGSGHAVHLPFLSEWHYQRDGRAENRDLLAALVADYAHRNRGSA